MHRINAPSRSRCLVIAVAIVWGSTAQVAESATFWDWLWGRTPYYRPQVAQTYRSPNGYWTHAPWQSRGIVAAPAAVPAVPAVTTPAISVPTPTTYQAGCDPCAQAMVPAASTMTTGNCCQPVPTYTPAANSYYYRARPVFRSSWYRVPVTTYRQVAINNPLGGGTVSQLQPCNTYTWQHRRLPVTSFRPLLSLGHQPATAVAAPSFFSGAPSACGTCTPVTGAVQAAPPSYAAPQTPLSPIPASPPASTSSPQNNSQDPASQRPTMDPPRQQGARRAPGISPKTFSQSSPASSAAAPQRTSSDRNRAVPIPDPAIRRDADPAAIQAPPLLGPRDNTAALELNYRMVTPISWNQKSLAVQPEPRKQATWDDSGWQSVGR